MARCKIGCNDGSQKSCKDLSRIALRFISRNLAGYLADHYDQYSGETILGERADVTAQPQATKRPRGTKCALVEEIDRCVITEEAEILSAHNEAFQDTVAIMSGKIVR